MLRLIKFLLKSALLLLLLAGLLAAAAIWYISSTPSGKQRLLDFALTAAEPYGIKIRSATLEALDTGGAVITGVDGCAKQDGIEHCVTLSALRIAPQLAPLKISAENIAMKLFSHGGLDLSEVRAESALLTVTHNLVDRLSGKVSADSTTSSYCVEIKSLSARVFDGRASLQLLDTCGLDKSREIKLTSINLGTLSKRFARERVYLDGIVDLKGNVSLPKGELRIDKGSFASKDPGGSLRYLGDAASLPDIAAQALKDFRYSSIKGTFGYQNGVITLDARVEGTSISLNTERPVNVNLHWEENVGSLLQIYKITNDIDSVLKSEELF